jgi:hypothetical protein
MNPLFKPRKSIKFHVILAAGLVAGASAQTPVLFNLQSFTGSGQNRTITITPQVSALISGTNIIAGTPITLRPTNGAALVNLISSAYTVSVDGVDTTWTIYVPPTNTTQYAWSLTTNLTAFSYQPWDNSLPAGLLTNSSSGNVVVLVDGTIFTGLTSTGATSSVTWSNQNNIYPPAGTCTSQADGQWGVDGYTDYSGFQIGNNNNLGFATQFRAGATFSLCSAQIYMKGKGSLGGSLYAWIASDSGTNPAAMISTLSSPVAASSVSTAANYSLVSFSLTASIASNNLYWICVTNSALGNSTNNIQVGYDSVDPTTPSQDMLRFNGGNWIHEGENQRMGFILYQ